MDVITKVLINSETKCQVSQMFAKSKVWKPDFIQITLLSSIDSSSSSYRYP